MSNTALPPLVAHESASSDEIESREGVRQSDGTVHWPDGTIDHPDGTVELNGYFFEIDWDELDPPEGHPDAQTVPHEVVVAEICERLGLPPGSLG
jgi:hypothetical protein